MGDVRRSATLAVVGLLLALPMVASAHQAREGAELHEVRIGVAAPPIVSQALGDSVSSLPGDPFEVVPIATGVIHQAAAMDAGRDALDDGSLDAVLVLDLSTTTDTLLVTSTRTTPYVDAVRDELTGISEGYGRTLRVERVEPTNGVAAAWAPGLLAGVWCGLGILTVIASTFLAGPADRDRTTTRRRVVLVLAVGGVAAVVSVVAADLGLTEHAAALAAAAVATVTVTGLLVLATEWVLELAGLAVAVAMAVGPTLPLLTGVTPDLLVEPWHTLDRAAPQTAAWEAARAALRQSDGGLGPWVVLAAWAASAVVALRTAQAMRPGGVRSRTGSPTAAAGR